MQERSGELKWVDRARLDARIAFVSASFLVAYGFAALLDRVGAPERFVGAAPPWFTIVALTALGFLLHSMRVSDYYTAGRAVPAAYAGFANAAVIIALALPFATRLAGGSWGPGVVGGLFIGVALAAFAIGPLLRKTGAFSICELLAARFPAPLPRYGLIAAAALSSGLLAAAGGLIAVDALVGLTGAGRVFAAFVIGAASLIIAGPGGLAGAIWAAAAAGGVALLGFGWPLAALGFHGELPVSLLGGDQGWRAAGALLSDWGVLPAPMNLFAEIGAAAAVALGVATLAPALSPAVTTADASAARRSGYAAFAWTLIFAALVAAAVAAAALKFSAATVGQAPERLPASVYAASGRGYVTICGEAVRDPAQARRACTAKGLPPGASLRPGDAHPRSGDYLLGALPASADLGAAASGLLASALIALGLALSVMGLQACAAAVGHDALYRLRGEVDLTSRRLALTRLALVAASAFGYVASVTHAVSAATLVSLAIALSAAGVAPAIALAFWPRAGEREAALALAGGALGLIAVLLIGGAGRIEIVALAGLAGATLGLAASVGAGLANGQEQPEAEIFVRRALRGDGQVLAPDKGA